MSSEDGRIAVGLNAVILAVTEETPRVLTVERAAGSPPALPFGPLDPGADRTLELGLRRWVREQAGMNVGYVEQLYTFGDRDRQADGHRDRPERVLSIAYLALTREPRDAPRLPARWRDIYELLPWEDWRGGEPASWEPILRGLDEWIVEEPVRSTVRRERVDVAFGRGGARWDGERALERYELLYEAGMVHEARRDRGEEERGDRPRRPASPGPGAPGEPMALDHRRMLATALSRVRGKIKYRPVVFEVLSPEFTLLRLQRVVEALAGVGLHKQNFRRLVERLGLVEGTGRVDPHTGGRPAELFRFRREVVRERRAPGVGLPEARR